MMDRRRNESLFYYVLANNIEELLPIVHMPTVSLYCQKYGPHVQEPAALPLYQHQGQGCACSLLLLLPNTYILISRRLTFAHNLPMRKVG